MDERRAQCRELHVRGRLFLLGLSPIQVTLGILGGVLIIFAVCMFFSGFMVMTPALRTRSSAG